MKTDIHRFTHQDTNMHRSMHEDTHINTVT